MCVEMISPPQIAAGEAKNPRRNLPKAIRRVYFRILFFYIAGVFIISLLVPSNDPGLGLSTGTAAASPFVIAIKRSGIKTLPGVRFILGSLLFRIATERLIVAAHKRMPFNLRLVRSIK
jgi:amino acid permease